MWKRIKEYLFPMRELREIIKLLECVVELELSNSRKLDRIIRVLSAENRFAVQITQEFPAMANGVVVGATGKFLAQLLDNGSPIALPAGASWSWSADDTTVTITPDTADATGATVDVAIPAGDPATTVTLTASTTDPAGQGVKGELSFPVLPVPQNFTVSISQLS